jgi:signal transduction histidine kinase
VRAFGADDASLLAVLARLLVTHGERERQAQLEGVLLAARTFEHELNNQLTSTMGFAERLVGDTALSERAHGQADHCLKSAQEAARIVKHLLHVTAVNVTDWGNQGTTIQVQADEESS